MSSRIRKLIVPRSEMGVRPSNSSRVPCVTRSMRFGVVVGGVFDFDFLDFLMGEVGVVMVVVVAGSSRKGLDSKPRAFQAS